MSHQIAKRLLEQAGTFPLRTVAVKDALDLRMPLNEIEQYLDWIDSTDRQPEPIEQPTAGDRPSAEN